MDDSEKLTALKKAYADIILNTAKEAAARIMASERKAIRLQQELVSTKEEALRMLLRLKQMLDSKVKEAELTSLTQQKKIDELEAQLQEAEEIVRDLRAELREAQDELENVTKHHMHPPVVQNIECQIAAHENFLQEHRLDPYDASVNSAPDSRFESVSVSDTTNPTVNGINDSSKLCMSHDHTNSCYIHNPNFASIVIRRKEPELYRNGCTQRVRAFERSLFDGNMSASGNSDNLHGETLVVHEEGKTMPVTTDTKADNICESVKPDELEVVKENAGLVNIPCHRKKTKHMRRKKTLLHGLLEECKMVPGTTDAKADNICEPVKLDELKEVKENAGVVKIQHHGKRSKNVGRKTLRNGLYSHKVKEINKTSDFANAKASPCGLDNNDLPRVNSYILNESEAQKDLMSPPLAKVPVQASATIEQSSSHNDTEKGKVFLKVCSARNKIKDDEERLDKSDLPKEDSLPTKSLEVPACRADVEAANGSLEKLEPKVSDMDVKVSCQSSSDKFLKYTFRRKRKKEFVGSTNVDCSPESSSLKKKCSEKQNGHAEPQKSCTMTESSRDSRRLAQVARQLISLSEKKWWQ